MISKSTSMQCVRRPDLSSIRLRHHKALRERLTTVYDNKAGVWGSAYIAPGLVAGRVEGVSTEGPSDNGGERVYVSAVSALVVVQLAFMRLG